MTPEIVIFSGLPATGKSTFYRELFSATHALVSKDVMSRSANKNVRQTALIEADLRSGRSVVVDNTNPTREERAILVKLGRSHGARVIGVRFVSTVGAAIARNERREGTARIPKVGIFTAAKRLQPIAEDEGFDEIWEVEILPDGSRRLEKTVVNP